MSIFKKKHEHKFIDLVAIRVTNIAILLLQKCETCRKRNWAYISPTDCPISINHETKVIITEPKPKVYCENCEWYKKTDESLMAQPKFQCFHPDNSCDNYESPKLLPVYPASCINANNDCSWYKSKSK